MSSPTLVKASHAPPLFQENGLENGHQLPRSIEGDACGVEHCGECERKRAHERIGCCKNSCREEKGDEISDPVTALLMNVEKALVEIGNKRYYNMISVIRLTSTYRKSNLR